MKADLRLITAEQARELLDRLFNARAGALARPDYQEPTFRCPECCDTGFLTRSDSRGQVYGHRCECLLAAIAMKPKTELRFRGRGREAPLDDGEGIPF